MARLSAFTRVNIVLAGTVKMAAPAKLKIRIKQDELRRIGAGPEHARVGPSSSRAPYPVLEAEVKIETPPIPVCHRAEGRRIAAWEEAQTDIVFFERYFL